MNWWGVLPTVAAIVVGVLGYLMKRSIAEMDSKVGDMSKKLDQASERMEQSLCDLRREFYEYKDKAADEFTRKADFVHATSDIGKKLDRVYDILLDLKGRVR